MFTLPDIHLYHSPGTRSDRVKLLLDLLGFPYEMTLVDQSIDEHKTENYLKVNPFGVMPGLTLNGAPVVESAAQMMILADLDPDHRFAPATNTPERKHYIQWMVAMPTSLEPMVMPIFSRLPKPGARKGVKTALAIQTQMFQGPYCAGSTLTAADIILHWGLRFVAQMGLLEGDPLWTEYAERLNVELGWANLNDGLATNR